MADLKIRIRVFGINITLVEKNIRDILRFSFPRVSVERIEVMMVALKELAALNEQLKGS